MEQPPRSDYISRLGTPADYGWARSGADTREEPSRGRLRFVDRARVAARLVARLGETGGARHITRRPPRYCRTCRRWTVLEERETRRAARVPPTLPTPTPPPPLPLFSGGATDDG